MPTFFYFKQLGCTSYLSLVPSADETPGLISNAMYQTVLHEFLSSLEGADILQAPASDYQFLNKQYPVPSNTPDLAAQVQQFLSLPPQDIRSRSTIWIFTFGTWDVWNLAALPQAMASDALEDMVRHIFDQAELLYLKALNPRSIAFSEFWVHVANSDMKKLMAPTASEIIDERALENFRMIIPKLLDITLAPVWHARQKPTHPHTRAQQLRNAVALTRLWNKKIEEKIEEWGKKGRSKPMGIELEGILSASNVPSSDAELEDFASQLPTETKQQKGQFDLVFAPYPKRIGALLPVAEPDITDAMREAEMRRGKRGDSAGSGGRVENNSMLFRNTWTPCFESTMKFPGKEERQSVISCDELDGYLFYDENTLNQRAINHISSMTANHVSRQLFPPQK